ncbi:TatD family hydrolase [Pleionea sediminis]|uniref:TatD family hydrolase n=1 Tax=Pleionea sediminis TaxID=2569479 RepID=UPI001185C3A9|nr:TatD family hydrolase [Pleionea sediminis]
MKIWTDICVNLTSSRFDKDRDDVLARAIDAGVTRMIIVATDLEHSMAAVELCEKYPQHLRCTVGCHPHDAKTMNEEKFTLLDALLQSPFAVAVGECGLDFNRNFSEPNQQIDIFLQQIELAIKHGLPLYLHERDAFREMISILHQYRGKLNKCLIHCFTGDEQQVTGYLQLDTYIGITGWICDERRNNDLLKAINLIPNDRLMIETDAPYLMPRTLKKKNNRNEPCYLPEIGEAVANSRNINADIIAAISTLNSATFFDWPVDMNAIQGAV